MRRDRVFGGRSLELLAAVFPASGRFRQLLAPDGGAAADTPVENPVRCEQVGVVVAVVGAVVDRERVAVHELLDFDVVESRERRGVLRHGRARRRQDCPERRSRERLRMHAASGQSIAGGGNEVRGWRLEGRG